MNLIRENFFFIFFVVDELLCYFGLVMFISCFVSEDMIIYGKRIFKGDLVLFFLIVVNIDL